SLQYGQSVNWAAWGSGTLTGAASGFASGVVGYGAGRLFGPGWAGSVIGGAAGGRGGDPGRPGRGWRGGTAGTGGRRAARGIGGALSHGLTSGLIRGKGALKGTIYSDQQAAWLTRNVVGGALGGLVGDALDQAANIYTGRQAEWEWDRAWTAAAHGALTSLAV